MPLNAKPTVALFIESSRAYGRNICLGIADYAHAHGGWNFVVREGDLHAGLPEWFDKWEGDGVICRLANPDLVEVLAAARCPVIDTYGQARHPNIACLDTDSMALAEMAVSFFKNAAFTSFAFCGYDGLWFSDQRCEAFRKALGTAGKGMKEYHSPISRTSRDVANREAAFPGGSAELADWVASLPPRTAVLACNDVRAQQFLNAAARVGRKVPDDLAVMGVDDDQVICELSNPRLTSIRPDARKLGYTAAHWLSCRMSGEPMRFNELLIPPLRVVERTSTDSIASEDEIFVTALRYIRDHATERIDVNTVVDHIGRSRSFLDARFRKILGRSVKDEMNRARTAKCALLLRDKKLPVDQIAELGGFATASHFSRVFKSHYGVTPGAYRNSLETMAPLSELK